MESIVKVSWKNSSNGWKARLMVATPDGFEKWNLTPERSFSFELSDGRRCTGYAPSQGERAKCPEFRRIDSGSQCGECRGKDIYSDYVRGDNQTDIEGEFSVYLAQISDSVKVGVTRTGNVRKRWVEQGADYGVKIHHGMDARVALDTESEISSNGIKERIRKDSKLPSADKPSALEKVMHKHSLEGDIVDVQDLTVYPEPEGDFRRKGLFEGELKSVKGQIISNGRICMAMSSGKTLKNPEQQGLNRF
ncbi:MAG: hypothetical protein BRC28_02785 [Nanohaloarchaea archaeon SW_4_43_9]|nr:MAG: hypothetical protein BRC28_02785 [Nanohaloarchaea archaeon SW_4_43_9]